MPYNNTTKENFLKSIESDIVRLEKVHGFLINIERGKVYKVIGNGSVILGRVCNFSYGDISAGIVLQIYSAPKHYYARHQKTMTIDTLDPDRIKFELVEDIDLPLYIGLETTTAFEKKLKSLRPAHD